MAKPSISCSTKAARISESCRRPQSATWRLAPGLSTRAASVSAVRLAAGGEVVEQERKHERVGARVRL